MGNRLTRLFLTRFFDNDLISPQADRHEVLSALVALLASTSLFVTVLLGVKYVAGMTPGRTALGLLDDSALFITGSMFVMALLAALEWHALSLDARDASILGPLPIPHTRIVRAKATAIVVFAATFAIALNLIPSIFYPFAATSVHAGPLGLLRLIAAQLLTTTASGLFGFASVFALRELLRAIVGAVWFKRVSTLVQGVIVVVLGTLLFLLPSSHGAVAASWLNTRVFRPSLVPPLWFIGLHQRLMGNVLDALPRPRLRGRPLAMETAATALYQSRRPLFPALAHDAVVGLLVCLALASLAYVWNSRTLPQPERQRRHHVLSAACHRIVSRTIARSPGAYAGFSLTIQVLWRSARHRTAIVIATAAGLAFSLANTRGGDLGERGSSVSVWMLAGQLGLIAAQLTGFRHALRLPAHERDECTFRMTWSGNIRSYMWGIRMGAMLGLVLPMQLVLVPGYVAIVGVAMACGQLVCAVAMAWVVLETLLAGVHTVPFAAPYAPVEDIKVRGTLFVAALIAWAYGAAWIEHLALPSIVGSAAFVLIGVLIATGIRLAAARLATRSLELEELPSLPTQRLDLAR